MTSPPKLTGTKHHEQLPLLPELPDVIPQQNGVR
jgi:hypothetical protein